MLIKNKKLIVLILATFFLCMNVSLVSAAANSDCAGFATMSYSDSNQGENGFGIVDISRGTSSNKYSNFLSIEQQLAIVDKESLNTAMLNLKKYCCENKLGGLSMEYATCSEDKEFYNDNIIDSPYLFDHLFDVVMRRLSGLTGEYDIYTKLEMKSDGSGLEWRGRLNSQAENVSGANPQMIINKYKEYWQQSSPDLGYDIVEKIENNFKIDDDAFLTYVSGQGESDDSEAVAEALKNYNKWTLYDRYNNACVVTQYLYALLDLGVNSEDKTKTINNLSDGICNKIVKNQIENEKSYVQVVILQAGNLFLKNYMDGYISYLYGRSQNLQKTRRDAADRFLDVSMKVPKIEKVCMK